MVRYIFLNKHQILMHCKTQQVEPAYIEWGNGAAAMQVSPVNLLDMKFCN